MTAPPIAFWRHWPIDDQEAESLARATLEFQRRFDWDFIKVTPSHTFCLDDYGAKHAYRGKPIGDRDHLERVVQQPEDWDKIEPVDVHKGAYSRQLRSLRMVIDGREGDTPVLQTLFNPLSMARYLAGDEAYLVHLRREPQRVKRALDALTKTCSDFAAAAIAEGADGIFLSTSSASYEAMSEEEYRGFGMPGDLAILQAAGKGWFNLLHLHGQNPMFNLAASYPIQAINWHDRTAWPSLSEAATIFPGALVGGVEQYQLLHFGTPTEVESQVHDAIAQMGGRRLIVAAGCTFPLTVPEGNLRAARRAVDSYQAKQVGTQA
ncbi:MAG TPA: uroporphyrinogen decarboxylase family protein [Chloroflexota bacterium]|nr:uroporphyrinogen decarboxylase family protein [Chloroflexota bacterium]